MAGLTGRGRAPQADMDADRVLDLLAHLQTHGITAWLDRGWAVDALLGHQRRPHDDLDLLVEIGEAARLPAALAEQGYALAQDCSTGRFELVDEAGHQVDVHPVRFTPESDGLYAMDSGEDWRFPAHGFAGQRPDPRPLRALPLSRRDDDVPRHRLRPGRGAPGRRGRPG
jgi:hypothetical protein